MRSWHRPGKNQSSGPPSSSSAVRKGGAPGRGCHPGRGSLVPWVGGNAVPQSRAAPAALRRGAGLGWGAAGWDLQRSVWSAEICRRPPSPWVLAMGVRAGRSHLGQDLTALSPLAGTVGVQISGLQEYGAVGGSTHAASAAMWACQHCTYMNQPGTDHCEMCSLPRS